MSADACDLEQAAPPLSGWSRFIYRINNEWHERALQVFMLIVLAHWAEHLVQALQIYVLGWDIPASKGILGLWYPWLVTSELLHYGYALVMLVIIWMLRSGFKGRSHTWWTIALVIQFWHHVEHAILQGQAIVGANLGNSPVPTSLVQLWVPRVELHLFYNSVVFMPMVVAMYYHMFPSAEDEAQHGCSCAWTPRTATNETASAAAAS
ncbi:MAG: hypothetical protein DHS20C15_11900 [Planctomycetota bacterium]|nr:MAG: hypothetical protein DHS20C15_11900 [Planctomycetota bacterium]